VGIETGDRIRDGAPRVSVLTAVHNGERYLEETIASVIAQSFGDFEYILIDDASTDGSAAMLAAWAARDGRIRLLHNERALNPAGALNRALAAARGDYVAVLDQTTTTLLFRRAWPNKLPILMLTRRWAWSVRK
jgi:cellulose synthase/poly-beta-1,6-N-acetylglucosamine synthase-like glycosyltransferase